MTIIFANHGDVDCATIARMWNGVEGINLVEITPNEDEFASEIRVDNAIAAEEDTLLLIGHGTTDGLLHPNFRGSYLIHENNIDLIRARRVICCWCYASTFCEAHDFHAFATSMFISNVGETYDNCIYGVEQESIDATNIRIYSEIMQLMQSETPLNEWVMIMGARMDAENPVDCFNRQGLLYS